MERYFLIEIFGHPRAVVRANDVNDAEHQARAGIAAKDLRVETLNPANEDDAKLLKAVYQLAEEGELFAQVLECEGETTPRDVVAEHAALMRNLTSGRLH